MSRRFALPAATILLVLFLVAPLVWTAVASITPDARLFGGQGWLPQTVELGHYRALFDERNFLIPVRNSLIVAGLTTALALPIGGAAAYAFARLRFRGKSALLAFVLAISMFPQISLVPPLYLLLREVGLIDTFPGLVVPYLTFAMPLTIWLMVAFFRQLPRELEEAAMMDGAGRLRVLTEIVLPVAWPGVAATSILIFLYSWNEFLFALSFTLGPERQTVPVAITLFRGRYQVPWGQVMAAAILASIPVMLLVLFFQRRIVQGLTAGALKQ